MPITYLTMGMGWLAICGIPVWAGFFSKDEILYRTFAAGGIGNWNYVLWIVGLLTAVLTAVYMTRLMVMTFFGSERFHGEEADVHAYSEHDEELPNSSSSDTGDDDEEHHHLPHDFKPHESPWSMTGPLVVLAVLATLGGLVGIPYAVSSLFGAGDVNVFEHTLEPVIAKIGHKPEHVTPSMESLEHSATAPRIEGNAIESKAIETAAESEHAENPGTERLLAVLSVLLALSGIAIGWTMFINTPLRKMPKILEEKWRIDEIYNGYIVDPITRLSRNGLWKGFDLGFIDGIVNGIGHFVMELSNLFRGIQVGFVRSYAAIILLGALVVLGYFIYFGLKLVG